MGSKIIIDYHGAVLERNPKPGQVYGIVYVQIGGLRQINCRFFNSTDMRDKFIEIHEDQFEPLLYVEL